jgi:hypothetical protein
MLITTVRRCGGMRKSEHLKHPPLRAKLNVDNYCAALWGDADDPSWFRARIVSVARNECEVFFIDYGNTDVVENSNIRVSDTFCRILHY